MELEKLPTDLIDKDSARMILGNVSSRTLRSLRESRRIRFYKLGHRTIRYSRSDLLAFVESIAIEPVWR